MSSPMLDFIATRSPTFTDNFQFNVESRVHNTIEPSDMIQVRIAKIRIRAYINNNAHCIVLSKLY